MLEERGGWHAVPSGPALKTGDEHHRVALLRERLRLEGDYLGDTSPAALSVYDEGLFAAVQQFQRRHGLEADGVVGPATIQQLNVPVANRISQLTLSLERLRKLPDAPDAEYVEVNIPSYRLFAYRGANRALQMDVIVGKRARPTPEFSNMITMVGLNPTWTPTQKILSRDLIPKFSRDPDYARRGGYRVKDRHTGQELLPWNVDWQSVSARDVQVVQRPGRNNALGKVKFLLPKNDSIYLHDTAKPSLFSKANRALSSGCIRLSDPEAFLDFIIESQPNERFAKLRDYYAGNQNKHVSLEQPIAVQTTYFTAWVNDEGQVEFYDDVYRKDDRLALAMEKTSRQFASR